MGNWSTAPIRLMVNVSARQFSQMGLNTTMKIDNSKKEQACFGYAGLFFLFAYHNVVCVFTGKVLPLRCLQGGFSFAFYAADNSRWQQVNNVKLPDMYIMNSSGIAKGPIEITVSLF